MLWELKNDILVRVFKTDTDYLFANVIYTDVWVSMGEPAEVWSERIQDLLPYQVNEKAFEKNRHFADCLHVPAPVCGM